MTKLSESYYEIENMNKTRNCIKGVNLGFTPLNTSYLISVHPLKKDQHLNKYMERGENQEGSEAGIVPGFPFAQRAHSLMVLPGCCPCRSRPCMWRLLRALGDLLLHLFLHELHSAHVCTRPVHVSSSAGGEGICKNI